LLECSDNQLKYSYTLRDYYLDQDDCECKYKDEIKYRYENVESCPEEKCEEGELCGTKKVAIVEFKYINDSKVNFYYQFYCDDEDCVFLSIPISSSQTCSNYSNCHKEYLNNYCGVNCNVERVSFYDVFNNPEGVTNIYPVGSNEEKYSYYSVYKLKEFYENEAQKYGVDLSINLDVYGPYNLSNKAPQRSRRDSVTPLVTFFDNETQKLNIDLSKYDVINYVYFTSENTFVSTVSGNKTYNEVSIHFDEIFNGINTIIHETAHVFGAWDTYSSQGWGCEFPYGFCEPDKEPLYPQDYACLMCGFIPLEEKSSIGAWSFDELKICEITAEKFGWK